MECATGVAAAASVAGKAAFDYNRENFHYDRELRQKKELHTLKYRVCQASQWRADIRDLISLTEYKMHIYLLVNVLLLAFAVTLWCEGRLPQGTPPWMMLGMSIATAAASTFLLLSIWFAMHAAVAAQSFEVRLLTQMVRLPIPSWQEVEACRTYGSGFEKVEAKQMFRVPFAMGRQESMALRSTERRRASEATTVPADATSTPRPQQAVEEGPADPWGLEGTGQHIEELGCPTSSAAGKCRHVKLALKAAIHWQSYDAFARISMSIGVNQLLLAIAYYLLGYIFVEVGVRSSAFLGVCVLGLMQEALTRLDMSLSAWQLHTVQFLLFMGPLFTCLASYFWSRGTDRGLDIAGGLIPFAFLFHGLYILVMTRMCRIQEQSNGAMLPMALGSVLFLDVFGHMRSDDEDVEEDTLPLGGIPPASDADMDAPSEESVAEEPSRQTCRPGLQAMQYSRGDPVPTRPEHAANTDKDMRHVEGAPSLRPGATEGDFYESSLFMPRAVASEEDEELDAQLEEVSFMTGHEHEQPGALPWTVFKVAMLLLWVAWLFAAIYSALTDARVWTLEIPFTEDVVDDLGVPSGYEVEPASNDTKHTKGQVSLLASSSRAQLAQGSLWKFWKSALLVTQEILGGTAEELELIWPDLVGAPSSISLSCDAAGQHFVASDGLLTWAADLREEVPGTGAFLHRPWPATCSFAEVRCPGLAGEALQDVALKCSSNRVDASDQCTAWVLHRRGERLTSCDVWSVADDSVGQRQPAKHRRWNISSSWLEQHRLGEHGSMLMEMPKTIALDDSCSEAGWCGFLGTSSGRVVRAQQHGRPGAPLLPTDVLHEWREDADASAALKAGPVRAFNKRFVGVLQQDRQSVQVLDVARGGLASGRVVLPAGVQASAFCAGGGYGFFLSGGPTMKLWRMRLPARLNPD
mmetsp:Transcript_8613/g.15453  ORF Transcript_8613/g.15453 Transcript_8613/m.15453 type:complete len:920 (-) Transcript_8613:31-2790(-)